jgi:phosphate starvation-inducible PhoH-like protein
MKKESPELKALSQYYKPKSYNQEQYVKYLNDYKTKVLFAVGPAGTGKTMFACNAAIRELKSGSINKIVLTRPVVPVEEDIGFLPGNINKKMDPWTRPIFDTFLEFFSQKDIDLMVYNNIIEISPLAYMRGRTFKKSFIIADEMQNSSPNQMKMLVTRLGENSRMVITGDLEQSDLTKENGLHDFIHKLHIFNDTTELIYRIHFDNDDIERSEIVKKIVDVYNYKITNKTINKSITNNQTLLTNQTITNNNTISSESDCALIPKNYGRFIETREF